MDISNAPLTDERRVGSRRAAPAPPRATLLLGVRGLQVSPKGELRNQYTQGCTGGPKSYNALANTVRVDDTSPDISVITTAYEIVSYPNVTLISHHGVGGDAVIEQLHADSFAGSRVVRWHRGETGRESYSGSDGALETAYNLFAFANPLSHAGRPESSSWSTLDGVGCSGGETSSLAIIDYHHVTSVHPGPDANFIVASKNLNAVWSIRADGTAAQWRLSSSMDTSDDTGVMHLAFEREADKVRARFCCCLRVSSSHTRLCALHGTSGYVCLGSQNCTRIFARGYCRATTKSRSSSRGAALLVLVVLFFIR